MTMIIPDKQTEDPRVRRTRQTLHAAFLALLGEMSPRAITVRDIADRAGVNRATFYAHYEDKFALMDAVLRDQFRGFLDRAIAPDGTSDEERLGHVITAVFEFFTVARHDCSPADSEFDPLFQRAIQEEVEREALGWLARRSREPALSRDERAIAARLISWAIFGTALHWSEGPRAVTATEMARRTHAVVARWL